MTEPTRGAEISVVSGRHARLPGLVGMRRACQAVLIILVVQFSMGMVLNLYVPVPASDAHAGLVQEIKTAPLALTVHVVLGLLLIAGASILLIRAAGIRDVPMIAMTTAGLVAILGAFGAGELFVRNGQSSASLTMAFLTAAALACYVAVLGRAGAGFRQPVRPTPYPARAAQPFGSPQAVPLPSRPHPVSGPQPRLGYRQTGPQPRLGYPQTGPQPRLGHPQTGPQPYLRDFDARQQPAGSWQQAIGQAPPTWPGTRPGAPMRRDPAFGSAAEPPPAPTGFGFPGGAVPPDGPGPGRGPATGPPDFDRWPDDDRPGAGTW